MEAPDSQVVANSRTLVRTTGKLNKSAKIYQVYFRAPWVWLLTAQFGCVLEQDDGPLIDGSIFGPNDLEILGGNFRVETREKDSLIYCDLYEDYFPP